MDTVRDGAHLTPGAAGWRRTAAVLVLGGALLLAGCGGSSKPPAAANPPAPASGSAEAGQANGGAQAAKLDPCALVTASDAEAILGLPIQKTERKDDTRQCVYVSATTPDRPISSTLGIMAGFWTEQSPVPKDVMDKKIKDYQDSMKPYVTPQPVPGVGDAAFWNDSSRQLTVFKGNVEFITVQAAKDMAATDALEKLKGLALKVISRLP